MFNKLRETVFRLNDEELTEKFAYLKKIDHKKTLLPEWWVPIEHDIGILRGIEKYGYSKWEIFCKDPNLLFFKVVHDDNEVRESPAKPKRGRKSYSDIKEFPRDRVLLKKINLLVKLAELTGKISSTVLESTKIETISIEVGVINESR